MKTAPVLLILLLSCVCVSYCKDLIVGTSFNNTLVWQHRAKYIAISAEERFEDIFYLGLQIIKGINALDLNRSDAIASLTAGGVGFSYANIRLKSGRGSGLNYQIEIYV